MAFALKGWVGVSRAIKVFFKDVFLAVQDSSIGDLVTQSLRHVLISATFERLLRDF